MYLHMHILNFYDFAKSALPKGGQDLICKLNSQEISTSKKNDCAVVGNHYVLITRIQITSLTIKSSASWKIYTSCTL